MLTAPTRQAGFWFLYEIIYYICCATTRRRFSYKNPCLRVAAERYEQELETGIESSCKLIKKMDLQLVKRLGKRKKLF